MTFIKGEPRLPNAGRKKGSRNKRTIALAEASEKALLVGLTPLDFLLGLLRDPTKDDRLRLDAAKAAAPYCHQKLIAIEDVSRTDDPNKSSAELRQELADMLAEMGYSEAICNAIAWGEARTETAFVSGHRHENDVSVQHQQIARPPARTRLVGYSTDGGR
jgi:hypothetical protein